MDDETRAAMAAMDAKIEAMGKQLQQARLDLHEAKRSLLDLCIADYETVVIAIANVTNDRDLASQGLERLRFHHAQVKGRVGGAILKEAGDERGE